MNRVLPFALLALLGSCATPPTASEANDALLALGDYGNWAWAVATILIWVDLVLPIPQTAVIAALGIIYGTLLGGALGAVALITGGLIGYGLMFTGLRRLVLRVVGVRSLHRMERFFDRGGAWAIVLTRSLPFSMAEAVVLLSGLAGMPMRKYLAALIAGSLPTAFAFAAIGSGWADQPATALFVSYIVPVAILPVALYLMRAGAR